MLSNPRVLAYFTSLQNRPIGEQKALLLEYLAQKYPFLKGGLSEQ